MCGEQALNALAAIHTLGSPPRVRGTALHAPVPHGLCGITPACAGNSWRFCLLDLRLWDHPRVCGEQGHIVYDNPGRGGSPPRVRGTGSLSWPKKTSRRITPACAGNRKETIMDISGLKDHPRVCGEQNSSALSIGARVGSPPRVRGTVFHLELLLQAPRITPACAGNRRCCSGCRPAGGDHPRVCGEQPSRLATAPR